MDYVKIHGEFVLYFKRTSPEERLIRRNELDERVISEDMIYTEVHHIIPRTLGGTNEESNLVEVLPEEHIFLHELRYKAFGERVDMLAVRFCLNGRSINGRYLLNKKVRSTYSFIKQHSCNFRKKVGWQTEDGRRRISESRKGMMPAKDKETGENVGSVPINHENVLSGKWVHRTTGFISVIDNKSGKKERISTSEYRNNKEAYTSNTGNQSGKRNSRYSGITNDQLIEWGVELSLELGKIPTHGLLKIYVEEMYGLTFPSSFSRMRFSGKFNNYIKMLEERTKMKYDCYINSNGVLNKQIKEICDVKNRMGR